jgi:putative transposase
MYGLMKSIHSDNGREFHGQAFRRGCDLNGIETIYRPPATPRFGGHIERLIGTFMRRTRLLPGNTYSDMLGRRPRSAESKATLTLGDYRSFLTEEIERYHNRVHRTLGASPRAAWERAWKRSRGVESPSIPHSKERFLMDFLPVRTRVVTREGIEIDGLRFSHESLQSEINPTVKRVVRVDPRDISRVYLETPDGPYITIPLRADHTMPSLSWWEWKAIRRQRNTHTGTSLFEPPHTTVLRADRARARRVEWQALQAIQSLPAPDTRLRPVVSSDIDSPLPQWEILD